MKQETRGRKAIPEDQKKIPVTIFIKQDFINSIGGKKVLQDKLYQLLKQNYEQSNNPSAI